MTDKEKKVEESGKSLPAGEAGNEERMTSESVTGDEHKSEIKHGLFHHHCKKCEEYKAGWQRATADYQNLKKEVENMRGEWARYSEQQILEEFIPVYDNFRKAFAVETRLIASVQEDKNWENWQKGIEHIMKQFGGVLKSHGVEEIKTMGEMFNPELHEAVGTGFENLSVQGEDQDLPTHEEIIVKEVEAGYVMRGKVIKVAKVVVGK